MVKILARSFRMVLFPFFFLLIGCASSDVSREVSCNVDLGINNAKKLFRGVTDGDMADSYGNSSQRAKGFLLGGAAGAVTGALVSGVGIFPGTATGALLGASYGSYIDSLSSLEDKLKNRGVVIIILGDQILIAIPSARIFAPYSANIKPSAYSTLGMVACYMNKFQKSMVNIGVYTNDNGTSEADLALSKQQARKLTKFLVAANLDARILVSEGHGGTHLVKDNHHGWDSDNYRIEIIFERLFA